MNSETQYHGAPCRYCQNTLRHKSNRSCVECLRAKQRKRDRHKYQVDKESIKAKNREYYSNNKESRRRSIRCWQENNQSKYKLMMQGVCTRRDARRKNAEGSFTAKELQDLQSNYHECPYCGSMAPPTIDHVLPLSRGGTNYITNIQLCCSRCNTSKGDKTHEEYTQYLEGAK